MKKITLILISFACSLSYAQAPIPVLNYDTTNGNVSFDFAFGTGFSEAKVPNPDTTTPNGNGTTAPGPNASARCLQLSSTAAVTAYGGGYGIQFNNQINLSTRDYIQCYVRSNANNIKIKLQFQDSPDNNCVGLNQNPMEADVTYTGNGAWQLVEARAAYTAMDTNCGGMDRGTAGDKTFQRITMFTDIDNAVTTAFTVWIDEIAQNSIPNALLSSVDVNKASIAIYPNPVNTPALNIKGAINSKSASVYDVTGKLLFKRDITGDFNSVDVEALAPGVYFLRLEEGQSLKFVK